ncbi:GGDEF domain-containing protein [Pseudofrankia inefficax]|uniref:Diguanylate cyclase n=1 Tax=Pseudofrankia inefficax (strain DSM 45817 / CECT 9037 / DDB 130130 / EuI1c) TaxID=298654 RepID=E3J500_PSEI1|nr:GGDEF domain-containing protein [Pseudofrankia inefficax]ADP79451.1 diguanylate cyclase [Pseudofrankia inefficax]
MRDVEKARSAGAPPRDAAVPVLSPRAFRRLAIGAAAFVLVVLVVAVSVDRPVAVVVEPASATFAAGAAAVCCAVGGWRNRGAQRWWRWLTGSAAASTMVGVAAAAMTAARSGTNVPRLDLSDLGYLVCYGLALAGLLIVPTDPLDQAPGGPGARDGPPDAGTPSSHGRRWLAVTVLDTLLVVGSLALLVWELLLSEVVMREGYSAIDVAMAWVLALAALMLVVPVFLLGAFRRPWHWPEFALLVAGVVLLALVAIIYAAAAVRRWPVVPPPLSTLFVASLVLIGLAAVVPAPPATTPRPNPGEFGARDRSSRVAVLHLVLPYVPLGAVGVLALVQLIEDTPIQRGETFALLCLLTLVLVRQIVTLWDNTRLLDRYRTSQRQLRYQAFHDSLTGLANRALFADRLRDAMERRARDGGRRSVAVLFCDLDDFKIVNDALGHAAGDDLLQLTADRLVRAVRPTDTVARLGGDEFAILLDGGAEDPCQLGHRVAAAVEAPCLLAGARYSVRGSVGVAIVEPGAVTGPEGLVHEADLAMYEAKRAGGSVVVYEPGLRRPGPARRPTKPRRPC